MLKTALANLRPIQRLSLIDYRRPAGELLKWSTVAQLTAVLRVTRAKPTELGWVWSAHGPISTFP